MLNEIHSFFDELRAQPKPPLPDISSADPREVAFLRLARATMIAAADIVAKADNDIEKWIIGLYEKGADDPGHIEFLDQVMAIIRKRHLAPDVRLREIAGLIGGLKN